MTFPQTITASQANKETALLEMFATLQWGSVYGNNPPATSGLTRGYHGGRWGGFEVSDDTNTFAVSETTYVCVDLSDGTLSFDTDDTNYLDTDNFAKVETVVTDASAITSVVDDRAGPGGVWGGEGGGPTLGTAATLDFDTDGTLAANSDALIATQKAVKTAIATAISGLLGGAPGSLDTLNELAAALADDANFATTVLGLLAGKAPLASPALTGTPTAPTPSPGDDDTSIATTAFVAAALAALGTGVSLSAVNVFTKNQSVAPVALTDAATIATDASLSNNFTLTMVTTGRVMGAPSNPTDGMVCNWAIDSGAGGLAMTWASAFDFGAAGAPTHSTSAGIVDLVSGYYHGGTSKWLVSFRAGT